MTNPLARLVLPVLLAACAGRALAQSPPFVPVGTKSNDSQFLFPNGAIVSSAELGAAGACLCPITGAPDRTVQ